MADDTLHSGAEDQTGTAATGTDAAIPSGPTAASAPTDDSTEGPPIPAPSPGSGSGSVPLSASSTTTPATVAPVIVEVFFQVYPVKQTHDGTAIGIPNVPYTITTAGSSSPVSNSTDANGRIQVALAPGSTATLHIFDTDFLITARETLEAVNTLAGQQRRLQMLGFDLGPTDVDGLRGARTEKALLDFQADAGLGIDGVAGSGTRTRLRHADWVGE